MLVDAHDRRVDRYDAIHVVGGNRERLHTFEQLSPQASLRPPVEVLEHRVPTPEPLGKVASRRADPILPNGRFHGQPSIRRRSPRRRCGRKQRTDRGPYLSEITSRDTHSRLADDHHKWLINTTLGPLPVSTSLARSQITFTACGARRV